MLRDFGLLRHNVRLRFTSPRLERGGWRPARDDYRSCGKDVFDRTHRIYRIYIPHPVHPVNPDLVSLQLLYPQISPASGSAHAAMPGVLVIIVILRPARPAFHEGRYGKDEKDDDRDDNARNKIPVPGEDDSDKCRQQRAKGEQSDPVHADVNITSGHGLQLKPKPSRPITGTSGPASGGGRKGVFDRMTGFAGCFFSSGSSGPLILLPAQIKSGGQGACKNGTEFLTGKYPGKTGQWAVLPKFKATTPMMIASRPNIFTAVIGSRK
jgi:hypothetical protein